MNQVIDAYQSSLQKNNGFHHLFLLKIIVYLLATARKHKHSCYVASEFSSHSYILSWNPVHILYYV